MSRMTWELKPYLTTYERGAAELALTAAGLTRSATDPDVWIGGGDPPRLVDLREVFPSPFTLIHYRRALVEGAA